MEAGLSLVKVNIFLILPNLPYSAAPKSKLLYIYVEILAFAAKLITLVFVCFVNVHQLTTDFYPRHIPPVFSFHLYLPQANLPSHIVPNKTNLEQQLQYRQQNNIIKKKAEAEDVPSSTSV